MTLEQVLAEMQSRFTSGNSIPVERAMIRQEEWLVILTALGHFQHGMTYAPQEETSSEPQSRL